MKVLRLVKYGLGSVYPIRMSHLVAVIIVGLVIQAGSAPLKIFILSGQSNMVGQGLIDSAATPGTLEYSVAHDADNTYRFASDGSGGWASFEDVWMYYNSSFGDLTTGYGLNSTVIGPELGFGYSIGNYFGEQVLLIKAAWGGKSLAVNFRPPSSGGTTGSYYNDILTEVNKVTANLATYFTDYDPAEGYELAGFCWHQGWSDFGNSAYVAEYEANMANFIRDIRSDLGTSFPFVIATTGMASGGLPDYSTIELAQLAVTNAANYPDFAGNVAVVDCKGFWRDPSDSPVSNGSQNFHWNRNATTYLDIGLSMADAIAALIPVDYPSSLKASCGSAGVTLSWSNGTEVPVSVQVLRDGVELAAALPGTQTSFVDAAVAPGEANYELVFTMSGDPVAALSTTIDTCIANLEAEPSEAGVVLSWINRLDYSGIEIRRDGVLLESAFSGSAETYADPTPPESGISTYTVVSIDGACAPASVEVNFNVPNQVTGPVLFADTFDRGNSTDLNASTDGKSGKLGALNYATEKFNTVTLDVNSSALRINGPASDGSYGGLVYINDHNFCDADIVTGGGFSISVDIAAYSTAGSGRQMSIGVGQSLTELGAQTGADPNSHSSDLVVAYRAATDALEIYKNGVLDGAESGYSGLPDAPVTMRIEYLLASFEAGSNVSYNVFFDDAATAFASGTFTWSGTDENYISLASNLSNDSRFDNLEIRGGLEVIDNDSPTPDPMTWATPPNASLSSAINMTATTASDASAVEYFFTCTAGDGHDSGWQDSSTYIDTGLTPETIYAYTVTARDKSSNQNATAASASVAAKTPATPTGLFDTFDDDGLDVNTGPGGGMGTFSRTGGPFVDNGVLDPQAVNHNDRGNIYSFNDFDLSAGFRLEVSYNIVHVASTSASRVNIGLMDAAENFAGQSNAGYITDYLSNSRGHYGIGMDLTANDENQGLQFSDGGTLMELAPIGFKTGTHSFVLEVDQDGNWSYSIDGGDSVSGTVPGGFDLKRDYKFYTFVQDTENDFTMNSVSLSPLNTEVEIGDIDMEIVAGSGMGFSWYGEAGLSYGLEVTDDLTSGIWETITNIPGADEIISLTDEMNKTNAFYRVFLNE